MSHLDTAPPAAISPALAEPRLVAVFAAVTRAEWTKLRTVRSTMWALLFAVAFGSAVAAFFVLQKGIFR